MCSIFDIFGLKPGNELAVLHRQLHWEVLKEGGIHAKRQ